MIIEFICDAIKTVIFSLLSWVNLPDFPEALVNSIDNFFDVLEQLTQFVGFFLPGNVVVGCVAIWLALFSFERTYPLIIWLIKKIPVSIE